MKKIILFFALFLISNLFRSTNLNFISDDPTFKRSVLSCTIPAQPSIISGNAVVCIGTLNTYSVTNDPLATSYIWTLPGGWTGTSATNVITTTAGNSGIISVVASNSCGISPAATLNINVSPIGFSNAAITSSNVSCGGGNNGQATITFTGGNAPITVFWSNSQNFLTATNLIAGSYSATLIDFYGCTITRTIAITQPPTLTLSVNTISASCSSSNGIASATASGGLPAYSYTWSTGFVGQALTNVPAGIYTVSATDVSGCLITSQVIVPNNSGPTLANITTSPAYCGNANGTATVTSVTGGLAPYLYSFNNGPFGLSTSQTGMLGGIKNVVIKDANSCILTLTFSIGNTGSPSATITSLNNPSCFGGSNGGFTVNTTGGVPGYGYTLTPGNISSTSGVFSNLTAQMYTVNVKDAVGCVTTVLAFITQPSSLIINVTGTNPKCFNAASGSANVAVLGGTPAYTYSWSPMPGIGGNTANPSGMGPGNYVVTVTDGKSCVITGTISLINPPQLLSSVSSTNISCFGGCNGKAIASLTNAVGAVSYTWLPISVTTPTVSGLCAGTYTMLAIDQNSCTTSNVVNITQPPALTVSISAVGSVSCSGGSNGFATASASGGTPTYTYNWSSSQTSVTATNLIAGNYTVTVTDSKSCIATAIATITQPLGMTATTTSTNVTCNGLNNGIGSITCTGGTTPYNILWQPNLAIGPLATNLAPGTHTITVVDANGCSLTKTVTITQPPPLIITTSSGITNCNQANGSASVTASGGTGGYTYLWSAGPTYTNALMNNVVAGAYTVTVKDANTCTLAAIAIINNIAGPTIAVTATTPANCYNGAAGGATVTAIGGMGPLTYMWSYLSQTTQNVNNLPAGSYTVTVTDQANCTAFALVNISQPSSTISASFIAFNGVSCNGGNNGSATILASGGSPGYTYLWTPSAQTNSALTNVTAGNYTCTVTDVNGCFVNNTINIFQPSALVTSVGSITNVACTGLFNGAAQVIVSGGTPGYSYLWSPSAQTNSVLTGVGSGIYTCSVTDISGCVNTKTVSITQPTPLLITTNTVIPNNCFGFTTGQINTSITGGTPIYTIAWSPAQPANPTITGLTAGSYSLTVFDMNGCITNSVYTLTDPPVLVISSSTTMISCGSSNSGSAAVNIFGGSPPYAYTWNSPLTQTTSFATGLAPGNYVLTTTDAGGCTINASLSIAAATTPTINVVSNASLICVGQTATLTASGANTYTWNTTATGSNITVNPANTTTYTVTATAANSCTNAATISQGVSLCTGINNLISEDDGVNIYPNPFSNEVIISMTNFKEEVSVTIYNSLGQIVFKTMLTQSSTTLNFEELPSGMYFVESGILKEKKLLKLIKD